MIKKLEIDFSQQNNVNGAGTYHNSGKFYSNG